MSRTVRVWIETNKAGSRCDLEFEVDDDATADDISEMAMDLRWNLAEWGWEETK